MLVKITTTTLRVAPMTMASTHGVAPTVAPPTTTITGQNMGAPPRPVPTMMPTGGAGPTPNPIEMAFNKSKGH